ncbi:formimidoylglutamate deiminase [Shimia litoralis]|uniref:Formimidoylglutamate deiminase n=1 Tax=Shimia litoralis TaxID=420403 RepID=A0A4U7MS01_9RHOB|nr:formimidoylglutamate deiminase [Shimia litoralis]TKZ15759.1 formimidoylglutamate deiminase [Shimia litoralis]
MTTGFHFKQALTDQGWQQNVSATITDTGNFETLVQDDNPNGYPVIENPVVPGMPNLHSHSFQYAMAGLSEVRRNPVDSFWSWREMMYYFAHNVSPEDLQAITAKLYMELLKGGYTEIVEFHYLHNDTDGGYYARAEELSAAVLSASNQTGLSLTHLPVFYAHANFSGVSPQDAQRRFINSRDQYLRLIEALKDPQAGHNLGIAPHSLRAVTEEEMTWLMDLRRDLLPGCPVHIHVAEQTKEVDDSLAHSGKRSVTALMDQAPVDETWCLIHSTHLDDSEVAAIAASGATVGLCPLTESNLGDGIFRAVDFLAADGHFGIGSDSNICTQPMQELRTLEYSQRLLHRQRNILCSEQLPNVGSYLWQKAAHGGARAAGRAIGRIAEGYRADFVELSHNINGIMAAVTPEAVLDFHMFAGQQAEIAGVYVAGRQIIRDGQHPQQAGIDASYISTMQRLAQKL